MREHVDGPPDEPGASLRRLTRLVAGTAAGWTPPQATVAAPAAASLADERGGPVVRRRLLVAPEPSALVWLVVAGLAVVLVSGYLLSRHHSGPTPVTSPAPRLVAPAVTTATGIVVDVGGRVRHPGLVTLSPGARVADAIAAAGGALRARDIALIDLAARVSDGQLLLIGMPGAAEGGGPGPAGAANPVNLNSATVDQLDALPGVGPVLAQRIVDWRAAHGGFRTVDDLQQVPGIGARKFSDLKALVSA